MKNDVPMRYLYRIYLKIYVSVTSPLPFLKKTLATTVMHSIKNYKIQFFFNILLRKNKKCIAQILIMFIK